MKTTSLSRAGLRTPRRGRGRRLVAAATLTAGLAVPMTALASSPASAAADCAVYKTSSGRPGGGLTGTCPGIPNWIQVVGLCQNIFTRSSRWVNGNWVHGGASFAGCAWYEVPIGGYIRIGSA